MPRRNIKKELLELKNKKIDSKYVNNDEENFNLKNNFASW